jgi:phage tail tape-measure protein
MDRFSRDGQRAMNGLRTSARGLSNGLDALGNRWTALGSVISIGGTAKYLLTLETQLKRIKVQAGLSATEVEKFKNELFQVSNMRDVAKSPEELLAAVDTIISKTGDINLARKNLRNIGLAMSATGAEGEDIGGMIAEMSQKLNVTDPKQIHQMLDLLATQGKEGTFELRDMSSQGPRVFTAMNRTGREGVDAVREMGAVLQVVRRGTSSADQASTAYERMIGGLIEKQKQLKKLGVDIWDPQALKQGRQQMRSTIDIFEELIRKTKGDQATLSQLFGEEAIRGVSSMATEWQKTKRFDGLEHFYKMQADGTQINKDAAEMADTVSASLDRATTSAKKYAETRFSTPLKKGGNMLSNFLDKPGAADKLLTGGLAIAGLVAVNKLVRGAGGLLGKGKVGSVIGGALGGAAGVTPVYVVNFPGMGASMPLGGFWEASAGGAGAAASTSRWTMLAKFGKRLPGMSKLLPAVEGMAENPAVVRSLGALGGMARSPIGRFAGGALRRFALPLALLGSGIEIGGAMMRGDRHGAVVGAGGLGGGLAGAAAGGVAGAAIGSVVPVIGTAAGGIVGAILGGLGGDAVGRALAGAIDSNINQKTKPLTKPKKDELNVRIQVDGPAKVTNVMSWGDSLLRTGVMTTGG